MQDILTDVLKLEVALQKPNDLARVGRVLKDLGWKKSRIRVPGNREYVYRPVGADDDEELS